MQALAPASGASPSSPQHHQGGGIRPMHNRIVQQALLRLEALQTCFIAAEA